MSLDSEARLSCNSLSWQSIPNGPEMKRRAEDERGFPALLPHRSLRWCLHTGRLGECQQGLIHFGLEDNATIRNSGSFEFRIRFSSCPGVDCTR